MKILLITKIFLIVVVLDQLVNLVRLWTDPQELTVYILLINSIQGIFITGMAIGLWFINSLMRIDREKKIEKILQSQDFYETMYLYRTANEIDQDRVVARFEDVKDWIMENTVHRFHG